MSVVVGYVPDATGFLAVTDAAREAVWRGTDVVIVNVIPEGGFQLPTAADEKDLDALAERLKAEGVPFDIQHVPQKLDHVADEILRVAEEQNAELIVVGLKRTSAVAKALLGSSAQRVLLGAKCPVLSVRARES